MTRTVFILRNEELGYVDLCPVFLDKDKAEEAAAFKCREHSVLEVPDTYQPCVPHTVVPSCLSCALYKPNRQKED